MKYRAGVVAASVLLALACSVEAQQNMYKIKLNPTGSMVALDKPVLLNGKYVFHAWPDGEQTALKVSVVQGIKQLTGPTHETIYQLDLNPSGSMIARDKPILKGNSYVFHTWRDGTLMSLRYSDVRAVTPLTGDDAFWAEQGQMGASSIGNFAMQGTNKVVEIGTPPTPPESSQAGPSSLSSINGAPAGNWSYQGQPGVSDAWGPANATMNNGVPTMPAATNGGAPPQ